MEQLAQFLLLGLVVGGIYALIALGLVLIFRASGVLNFAQGQFMLFGAAIVWSFSDSISIPLWASLILGLGCAFLLGMLIERVAFRPMLGQPVFAIIVMTLAMSVVLEPIYSLVWGSGGKGYHTTLLPTGTFHLGNILLPQFQVYSLLVIIAVFAALFFYLRRSRSGLAMQAIADDTQAARSLGVRATTILSLTWALAAVVAMIGGYFLACLIGIEVTVLPVFGLKAVAVMIFGGLQSIEGVLIAGPIIGILEYLAGGYIDPIVGGGLKDIFPYIIMMFALIIRPSGLFGWKIIERI